MTSRPGFHAARANKGHPRRAARRARAAERLALHEHHPGCKRNRLADPAAAYQWRFGRPMLP